MNTEEIKLKLLNILAKKSFKQDNDPVFTLASGRRSHYYINCKASILDGPTMYLVGNLFFERIRDLNIAAIGGLTHGADPISMSTALLSVLRCSPVNTFIVRKEPKQYGMGNLIEGSVKRGDRVAIVDDVATTGVSTVQAIRAAREYGLVVVKAVVLVDRQEGGRETIEKEGVPFEAIYTVEDLVGACGCC